MREINRLGALQMRVAGNNHVRIFRAEFDERFLQAAKFFGKFRNLVAQPHPNIQRDLVIPRTSRVEFRSGGNALGQFRLDVHVDIFELRFPLEIAVGDFLPDLFQPFFDLRQLRFRQHADFLEHRGVGDGAENVVFPKPPIEGNGFGELRDIRARPACETSAARNWRRFFHAVQSRRMCGEQERMSKTKKRRSFLRRFAENNFVISPSPSRRW